MADALHIRSASRYNDGSLVSVVALQPMDGIVLERFAGDFDDNGTVDQDDFYHFDVCFTGSGGGPVGSDCEPGDFDLDNDVDCDDWDQFVLAWTEPGDPPKLAQCTDAIPTVSDWRLMAMALLVVTAGAVVLR